MSAPKGVFASEDTLTAWVADTGNNRIVVWTRDNTAATTWNYSTQFGSGPASGDSNFNTPSGVFISEDMLTAWVGDTLNNRISIWTRSTTSSTTWTHSTSFGTNGSSADQFNAPKGVFVSANSLTAWVADQSNNRISIWTQS
jgi:DNA-binding beta-propeller fold protein YncE